MDPLSITAVGWLMSSLVNKAVTASLEAWAKENDLENEFETLKDQLLQLGALLTTGVRTNNSSLKELVEELQELAYGAENLLDELDYYRLEDQIPWRGTQEEGKHITFRSFLSIYNGHFRRRMNELAEHLQESKWKVRNAVQIESVVITARNTKISHIEATNLHQTSSFLTESSVFGRGQKRDQLMNLLTNKESAIVGSVNVLAIVGDGGVGKTTLAQLVFNDPKVQSCFEVRSWICVSTHFDIVRLAREMLGVCGNRYGELFNLEELQNKLKDKLESKRFLLVLDDIWEGEDIKSQWTSMVALLNNCMMRRAIILVTTRNHSVVEMVNARDNIYLHCLDDNALSSFFSTCIFDDPNYGGCWRLRNIGEQIAVKLKGNPLAAKSVSALLKENLDERYWIEIRDSEVWKFKSGPNDIMPALRLSYEHMPFHLQRCFSYCAIFPEDHTFTCEELVYLWMAQGFLDVRSEGKRMEDIGSDYFNDLLNRGFFQSKPSAYDGLVCYTFHNHLLYRFARMVSLKECLTIGCTEARQILPTIRHLSFFDCTKSGEYLTINSALLRLKGENLSTLISWDELPFGNLLSISYLLKKTKFLRAVRLSLQQLHHCKFQKFISLRYLRLVMPNINTNKTLPRHICSLYHLEVFVIEGEWFLDELPNKFSDLVSLRHFIVEGKLHTKIQSVGKLTSLQELNHFDVQQEIGFEIEQLGSLKEIGGSLQIRNLEKVKSVGEASKARLAEKEKLDALYLHWNQGEQENKSVLEGLRPNTNLKSLHIEGYGGVASPTWLDPSLIFLESLTLINCKAWEKLPPLGELEFLKDLKLSRLPLREIGPQFYGTRHSMKFPSLEELWIVDMEDLRRWEWNDQLQLFPCLKKLSVLHCTKLVNLPLSGCSTSEVLERFASLESLIIEDCPLIFQLPPLHSSPLSYISTKRTGSSSLKMGESLVFNELISVRFLEISNISSVQSLDLHYFVALKNLVISECESLTSLTFGEHLVCLKTLSIISCQTLSSMEGLKSWVNLEKLYIRECPGFIAAWDSASKELERTEPDFSLSLTRIEVDSLALLTLPICKQLTSLQIFELRFYAFTEEHEISPQFLTSIDLVDIKDCKNLQSFPLDLFFPSLKKLRIMFPHIESLPTNSRTNITEKCLKVRNIKEIHIRESPVKIEFVLSSEEMICQQMDSISTQRRSVRDTACLPSFPVYFL